MSEESRMIPGWLREVAKSIRDLVAAGKAVHVDLDVAQELDLIATFPWPDVSMLVDDIAWAWLKLSRGCEAGEDAERAAKYAEVLLIAAQVRINFTWLPDAHDGTREGARAAWKFIHGHMLVEAGNAWDRYRRELEAM